MNGANESIATSEDFARAAPATGAPAPSGFPKESLPRAIVGAF